MSLRWYYQLLMEEVGPVSVDQIRDLLDKGTLTDDHLVRSESSADWTTIAAVKLYISL